MPTSKREIPYDVQGMLGAAGTHYAIDLVWTNRAHVSCTLSGFAGVDMIGPSEPDSSPRYPLPHDQDVSQTSAVVLPPEGKAYTTVFFIDPSGSIPPGQHKPVWTPTHLEVTPPDETTRLTVPWSTGTPVVQDPEVGAAAASVTPVRASP
jgi:uncharacterized protein DUF4232